MQNFFTRKQQNLPYFPNYCPQTPENRPQQSSERGFRRHTAQDHSQQPDGADIPPADRKIQPEPSIAGSRQKNTVGCQSMLRPQGPQKFIKNPKKSTQAQTDQKPESCLPGAVHRIRRLSQPPEIRFCSYCRLPISPSTVTFPPSGISAFSCRFSP